MPKSKPRRLRIAKLYVPAWERLEPEWPTPRPPPTLTPSIEDILAPHPGQRRNPSPEARAIVSRMSGAGFSVSKISRLTGYRPSTLYRSFRQEIVTSADLRDLDVIDSAFEQARGGPEKNWKAAEPSMTRFWLGKRLGWKMPTAYDNVDKGAVADLDRLSDEELHELDRLLTKARDEGGRGGGA